MERVTVFPPSSRFKRRGNAVLDLALVLPILLALAFGTVEYGYYFFVKNTLQGAAREGARRAIVSGATEDDVAAAVQNVMTSSGFDADEYSIDAPDPATLDAGDNVEVIVTATWGAIGVEPLPDALGGISSDQAVRGATTMRKE